jgi:hypothetical protein
MRNFVSEKEVDVVAMPQKRQRNMGGLEAIEAHLVGATI